MRTFSNKGNTAQLYKILKYEVPDFFQQILAVEKEDLKDTVEVLRSYVEKRLEVT